MAEPFYKHPYFRLVLYVVVAFSTGYAVAQMPYQRNEISFASPEISQAASQPSAPAGKESCNPSQRQTQDCVRWTQADPGANEFLSSIPMGNFVFDFNRRSVGKAFSTTKKITSVTLHYERSSAAPSSFQPPAITVWAKSSNQWTNVTDQFASTGPQVKNDNRRGYAITFAATPGSNVRATAVKVLSSSTNTNSRKVYMFAKNQKFQEMLTMTLEEDTVSRETTSNPFINLTPGHPYIPGQLAPPLPTFPKELRWDFSPGTQPVSKKDILINIGVDPNFRTAPVSLEEPTDSNSYVFDYTPRSNQLCRILPLKPNTDYYWMVFDARKLSPIAARDETTMMFRTPPILSDICNM